VNSLQERVEEIVLFTEPALTLLSSGRLSGATKFRSRNMNWRPVAEDLHLAASLRYLLDRIIHKGNRIELKSDSLRRCADEKKKT
jgi:hypothetical protein